ncbi:formate/nitrite transporter family protein [Devosia sp. RR2S18]|uniref:formate/nitrite transporter family protein n=1 Tax=Devosia rhizosphaerae TaxID=3049774 RepID=UPI00253F6773|nr:formate/nitrite transporter family protein [Devosia sp. RR2S18]WIJ24967.1 formate/nitrite transporter family protein [Devosia sp. RR2S18]
MSEVLTPSEAFKHAAKEGERRLDQSLLELLSTGFIAGFTIVFGIIGLGLVHGVFGAGSGAAGELAGALAFALGVVFLVVGRAELFSENFFDPVAALVQNKQPSGVPKLLRLWGVTFALNLIGGGLFALVFAVDGVLPTAALEALASFAEEIAERNSLAHLFKGIAGGALVILLSFLLAASTSLGSRIALSFMTGFLLELGPFDHVVVTGLHLIVGMLSGAEVGGWTFAQSLTLVTAGNLMGGLGLVTMTHIAQAKG